MRLLPLDDEDREERLWWERLVGALVLAACVWAVLAMLHPSKLLADTTTNGGDMGAHVWWPAFLRDNWFGRLRLSGWAPDWYAGFPVGQFYFPLPALLIAALDVLIPYNVAFKLVTALGAAALPAGAYVFARGIRAPWPAPPAFAVAGLATLVHTRWTIYGGNLASNLAGEFSFTLGIALTLFFLGTLARALETGRRLWLPTLLLAAVVTSHIVVVAFAAVGAVLVWLVRRPLRTWTVAGAVALVAALLTSVWTLPLVAAQGYTTNMRYEKVVELRAGFVLPSWARFFGPFEHLVEGLVGSKHLMPAVPGWMWFLIGVAIVAAGWWRRRVTLVLLSLSLFFAVVFVQWPEHHVWNTRFLPFWLLSTSLLAAMGVVEIARFTSRLAVWAADWVREGDLQDARAAAVAPQPPASATGPSGSDSPATVLDADDANDADDPDDADDTADAADTVGDGDAVGAERWPPYPTDPSPESGRPDPPDANLPAGPPAAPAPGWAPPEMPEWLHSGPRVEARRRVVVALVLALFVAVGGSFAIQRAWDARDFVPGWANWNYSGYERKPAWPEFDEIIRTMGALPPGRALWEPSSDIDKYGTTLALELLPYFTDGRIGSMEGLYFESAATTPYHFLAVSELTAAGKASNPVRGLVYGSIEDFDRGVRHLQMLGVRYFMAQSADAKARADEHQNLRLVAEVPDRDGQPPDGWKIYEVADAPLVEGLRYEPVVARVKAGTTSECFDQSEPAPGAKDPDLVAWECGAAPWWMDSGALDRPFADAGPDEWERVGIDDLTTVPFEELPEVAVTDIDEQPDEISFHVSRTGVPVVVKTSFFPNWEVHGARGPWRLAPNLMVVVPTREDVRLEYGLTGVDWLGRILTLLGLVGLGGLVVWRPRPHLVAAGDGVGGDDGAGYERFPGYEEHEGPETPAVGPSGGAADGPESGGDPGPPALP